MIDGFVSPCLKTDLVSLTFHQFLRVWKLEEDTQALWPTISLSSATCCECATNCILGLQGDPSSPSESLRTKVQDTLWWHHCLMWQPRRKHPSDLEITEATLWLVGEDLLGFRSLSTFPCHTFSPDFCRMMFQSIVMMKEVVCLRREQNQSLSKWPLPGSQT